MLKKFFSVALLLTVCVMAQASAPAADSSAAATTVAVSQPAASTSAATAAVDAAKPAADAAKPAEAPCSKAKEGGCKATNFICTWSKTVWDYLYTQHPYATLSAGGVATVAALYNYSETFRSMLGLGSDESAKCPCTKPPRAEA